mmetsp:Transcript_3198/g.7539  ORF Transcript_3198/g.7539 Transcript_3198/m.7539 type:complete len:201 (-) Transcript_3198:345-947(-)
MKMKLFDWMLGGVGGVDRALCEDLEGVLSYNFCSRGTTRSHGSRIAGVVDEVAPPRGPPTRALLHENRKMRRNAAATSFLFGFGSSKKKKSAEQVCDCKAKEKQNEKEIRHSVEAGVAMNARKDLQEQLEQQVIYTTHAKRYADDLQSKLEAILATAQQVHSDAQRSLEQTAAALANTGKAKLERELNPPEVEAGETNTN